MEQVERLYAQNWIEQWRRATSFEGESLRCRDSWYDIIGSFFIWAYTPEGQAVWEVREHCSDLMMR